MFVFYDTDDLMLGILFVILFYFMDYHLSSITISF